MRILFIGQLGHGQTTRMRMEVLASLGHEIVPLDSSKFWTYLPWAKRQVQQKVGTGSAVSALNAAVLRLAREYKPDLLWGEKQEFLHPETLEELRRRGARLLHFTPDPYFSLSWKRTRLMDACMPLFDTVVSCKKYEMDEYSRVCRQILYMPLGYAPEVHRPLSPASYEQARASRSDVGFLGGWEPRRESMLDAVARLDCDLKIWGYAWDHLRDGKWTPRRAVRLKMLAGKESFAINQNERLAWALQGGEVYGDAYAWALSGARISVGFLRHVCPDQHTTRTFEIPACASMMLADRTPEHQEFFEEGHEAEFFSSPEEMVDKLRFYLGHEESRHKLAWRGLQRCEQSGYSYRHRILGVLAQLQ